MAEFLLNQVLELIKGEVPLLTGVGEDAEKLMTKLRRIQACINDAERREVTEEAVRLWLEEVKDVAYDADDVIHEFKAMQDGNSAPEKQVSSLFSSPLTYVNKVTRRSKIGKRVREMSEKIDDVMDEGFKLGLREGVTKRLRIGTAGRPETDSFVTESEIYGRDEDKIAIVDMLLDNGSSGTLEMQDLSVIPIVGLGGLGKTTLAKLAYNDERITKHFEKKTWVCVSENFDEKRVIKAMMDSTADYYLSELNQLASWLRKELNQKKFLLVLDDVWDEDVEKWSRMRTLLRSCGGKGSRIIVTTRSEKVARIMGTTNSYHLGFLSNDDCWSLFKQRAFGRETENAHPSLEQIGKEIVMKCKGVPLAAKALGSMMLFMTEEKDWLDVRDCEIWNLPDDQNGILPELRLSYNNLPAYLKQCFQYCSIFPKDYKFEKDTLIQQWIAQGFIQSSTGCRLAEDIGNEYFKDLLWRSFFQDIEKDEWGNIRKCKMHDLIHDLARSVTRNSCLILDINNDKKRSPNQARHLSLLCGGDAIMPPSLYEAKSLRTFLILKDCTGLVLPSEALDKMFLSFMFLRVLTIRAYVCWDLPTSIGNLIHLRYFDITGTGISRLQSSISNLKNLQTLKLGKSFRELPQELSCLENLRHLDVSRCHELDHMPSKIGELSSLQTLSRFIVSKDNRCGIGELHKLDLRGCINIENLENVENVADARRANLKYKCHLQKLRLYWSEDTKINNMEEVLEGLVPHPNLKTLSLENYSCVRFSSWLVNLMLPNLVEVLLYNCRNCDLPPFGSLPSLKILVLDRMHGVKCLNVEFDQSCTVKGFPSLKKLHLHDMPNLEVLSHTDGKDFLPCLEELSISCCPTLTSLPMLSSLKNLNLYESNSTMLNSVASLTSLSLLGIDRFKELESLPEGMLQPLNLLHSLEITKCDELRSLPREMENLTSLENLQIFSCSKLECLPEELQHLTSLKYLEIYECNNLTSFPDEAIQGLTALREFSIVLCRELTCLPSGFQHLTLLENLELRTLPKLTALPEDMKHLTNLQTFMLEEIDRFTSLPEWLGSLTSLKSLNIIKMENLTSLPAGMRNLSSLHYLWISGCPHLNVRCRKDTGEDWHKIRHISSVTIDLHHPYRSQYGHVRWKKTVTGEDWHKIQHIPSVNIDLHHPYRRQYRSALSINEERRYRKKLRYRKTKTFQRVWSVQTEHILYP